MAKPTSKPDWTVGNPSFGTTTVEPSAPKKVSGFTLNERPTRQLLNWLFYNLHKWIEYFNQKGIPDWDAVTTYSQYDFVSKNGVVYYSLQNTNLNHDPTVVGNYWKIYNGTSTPTKGAASIITSDWNLRSAESVGLMWEDVIWNDYLNIFVTVSITGTGTRVMTSPDAINWTLRTVPEDNLWLGLCWSPELTLHVAVAGTGTNRVMTSFNGATWTARTAAAANNWRRVCWSKELGLFCAVSTTGVGNRVMTSPDGITWTSRTSAADNNWQDICWSPQLRLFCAVANTGTGNRVMTSPDGITWTTRTTIDNNWNAVCWSPELGIFCSVSDSGSGNRVMTSTDGITWTLRSSAANNTWTDVIWVADLGCFVSVSQTVNSTGVQISYDGITWILKNTPAQNATWVAVAFSPLLQMFVATGPNADGTVLTSYYRNGANGWLKNYRSLLQVSASHTGSKASGTYAMGFGDPGVIPSTGSLYPIGLIYLPYSTGLTSDSTVNGWNTAYRLRAVISSNAQGLTSPNDVVTVALYPVTAQAGGAGLVTYTLGTKLNSSSLGIQDLTNTTLVSNTVFTAPSSGLYCIAYNVVVAMPVNAHFHIQATLEVGNAF